MTQIDLLRNKMKQQNIDIVIIPSGDYHQSEYSCAYFKLVRYFSGFTGSAGTLVVSTKDAWLFTDGRYFVQAEKQLMDTGIKLMKMGTEGVKPVYEFVADIAGKNAVIGYDGRIVSALFGRKLSETVAKDVSIDYSFVPEADIYIDRPALPKDKLFVLEKEYSGEASADKIHKIRNIMKEKHADMHIVSSLDDIAWILNMRGFDVKYTPVFMSYFILTENEAMLFVDEDKLDDDIRQYLQENKTSVCSYDEFYTYLDNIKNKNCLLDISKSNYYIYKKMSENGMCILDMNPSTQLKAIKNKTELDNLYKAHIKDGVAVTKFMIWLKESIKERKMTEYDASYYLGELRRQQEGFIEESFETISAYGPNAAMMHYSCDEESAATLLPRGMLLVDSGGQYYEGTTDVTRTFALGEVSAEEKRDFTLVLKGMLNLSNARFLYGCSGINLDILARGPVWEYATDYRCGTGHGVSYLMSVHEGPNSFRWRKSVGEKEWILEEGMVTTNEPGVYVEGKYGIRTENELVCIKDTKNEYGQFMKFDTLTLVPIDTDLIDKTYLNEVDISRINAYNLKVISTLLPYFDEKERLWLKKNVQILH